MQIVCNDEVLTKKILLVLHFSLNRYKYSIDQFETYPKIKAFVLDEAQAGWLQEFCEALLSVNIEDEINEEFEHE